MKSKLMAVACVSLALAGMSPVTADEGGDDMEQIPSCGAVVIGSEPTSTWNLGRPSSSAQSGTAMDSPVRKTG